MPRFGRTTPQDDARAAAWREWLAGRNVLAIASFVLGAVSLTHLGVLIVDGVAGVVLGAIALKQLGDARQANVPRRHGDRLAFAGIGLSLASLGAAAVIYGRAVG
jgi:hypothetical protein